MSQSPKTRNSPDAASRAARADRAAHILAQQQEMDNKAADATLTGRESARDTDVRETHSPLAAAWAAAPPTASAPRPRAADPRRPHHPDVPSPLRNAVPDSPPDMLPVGTAREQPDVLRSAGPGAGGPARAASGDNSGRGLPPARRGVTGVTARYDST